MKIPLPTRLVLERLLNRLCVMLVIAMYPAVAFSIARARDFGWQPVHSFHLLILVAATILALFVGRIPYGMKLASLMGVFLFLGAFGLLRRGTGGYAVEMLEIGIVIGTVFLGMRFGVALALTAAAAVVIAGICDSQGILQFNVDQGAYSHVLSAWLSKAAGLLFLSGVFIMISGYLFCLLTEHVSAAAQRGEALTQAYKRLKQEALRRKEAEQELRVLSGLLPICSSCKQIRDADGNWDALEEYICEHSEAKFSHGLCPKCAEKMYPEYFEDESGH